MQEAVERGPHVSALNPEAIAQMAEEVEEKVRKGQVRVVEWDMIKHNPPKELKISPLAMIPHKSRKFRAILDLSFRLRLKCGDMLKSVNESTTLSAPAGAIDQLGHVLSRVIHAMAEAAEEEDTKVFMCKFDIKDGFWRMNCKSGEEWNFAYVLPQEEGKPVKLVIPKSLQMGWVESPPYFGAGSETARDIAEQYVETPVGSLKDNKFVEYAMGGEDCQQLPAEGSSSDLKYFLGVYVDDFINMAVARTQKQLRHVANSVMTAIHNVFPADEVDANDPISHKKLEKLEGQWALEKEILGFDFDGDHKTMILALQKRDFLLKILKTWIRQANGSKAGIPFAEFESVVSKLRHAFIALPAGKGLLTGCNKLLSLRPPRVYLQRNKELKQCMDDCRRLLRESTVSPTPCRELVMGNPHYVGVKDASIHGVGGIVVGDEKACVPTVFRLEWPEDIRQEVLKTNAGKGGKLTNSDLECAGLLLLFMVMEAVCNFEPGDHLLIFSDNSPTVHWVRRMAARGSLVAGQLLRALALRMKANHVSPLTPLHIQGVQNPMTDIPSRSWGSEAKWHCETDEDLLTLFNSSFPLPEQKSWTVFQITSGISMRVISLLRMQVSSMDGWRRLPRIGRHIGEIGAATSGLWEWTLIYRTSTTKNGLDCSQALRLESVMEDLVIEERSRVTQWQRLFQPLAQRSLWCAAQTL
jgi:hypothetical protein